MGLSLSGLVSFVSRYSGQKLASLGRRLIGFANRVSTDKHTTDPDALNQWRKINGDKTLRLAYDLSPDSIVFDVGGYEGQWASDVFSRYCCNIYIFEPIPDFVENIIARFARNDKIQVYPFGLSGESAEAYMTPAADASSLFRSSGTGESVKVQLVNIVDFIAGHKIEHIDLIKINIEGGEFDLISHLIDSGYITRITDIQVQFHKFFNNAVIEKEILRSKLSKTHDLTYEYPWVWENWRIK